MLRLLRRSTTGSLWRTKALAAVQATASARHKIATFRIDLDDPDSVLLYAREQRLALAQEGQEYGPKDLQQLITTAMAHFTKGDLGMARACALYAFDTIVQVKGPDAYLTYFAAMTAYKITEAAEMELRRIAELRNQERMASASESTQREQVSAAKVSDVVTKLQKDKEHYKALALRIYSAPHMAHLRGGGAPMRESSTAWDDTDCSSETGVRDNEGARRRTQSQEIRRNRRFAAGPEAKINR